MDNRLIFLYHFISDGVTHLENELPVNEFRGKLLAYADLGKSVSVRE